MRVVSSMVRLFGFQDKIKFQLFLLHSYRINTVCQAMDFSVTRHDLRQKGQMRNGGEGKLPAIHLLGRCLMNRSTRQLPEVQVVLP